MSYTAYDINKFPKDFGIIVFPISMSRIDNAQSPKECIDVLYKFRDKVQEPKVGINFLYTEALYMNFEDKAYETKNIFAQKMVNHMNGIKNLVEKNYQDFQIHDGFHFDSWFQMYLSYNDFMSFLKTVKDDYVSDKTFQKFVQEDAQANNRELTEQQINFFLEEFAMTYLILNRKLTLTNAHVNGKEEWVLVVYPGRPLKGLIYFCQKDLLKIATDANHYNGFYDTLENKYYDFSKINLTEF